MSARNVRWWESVPTEGSATPRQRHKLQKRKFAVNFGESISFLSMVEVSSEEPFFAGTSFDVSARTLRIVPTQRYQKTFDYFFW
jgi:hypothetical protein